MSNRSKKVTTVTDQTNTIVDYTELTDFNQSVINDEDSQVTKEFKSVSEQIRYLFDSGTKQSIIAKQLNIRDQMVSNVIRKYKSVK